MNAKEQYAKDYQAIRKSSNFRWHVENGHGAKSHEKALTSYRMTTVKNPMTFKQFVDCLEASYTGKAYATRNHWFFIVDGQELQFTKEECARFARYFSEGFHMNFAGYTYILKSGGLYINERLFEDDEVFPLKAKVGAYTHWIIGSRCHNFAYRWVSSHNVTCAKIEADAIADEFYAHYQTEQSDLRAEMEMQCYGL